VVANSATRAPGQEITGRILEPTALRADLQAAEHKAQSGDVLGAIKAYQKILDSDPNQPQALVGEGWLLAETQQPALLQRGITMLTSAEKADPSYPAAHVYRGIALLSEDDYADCIPELQWYLGHNPDPQLAARVRQALSQAQIQARAAAGGPSPAGP
jgi:cytochrome c-type biogenesis protein CcmH/NrfG